MKGEKYSGGKYSKVRLTGMAAASVTGEKLPMLVIGKSVKPRCFKHVKNLPFRYRAQPKSWMISFLFDEWVKELDRKFEKENRKIVLIVDNCPAHPINEGLKAIELVFLPLNTTSKTQPMDQGVLRSLKTKYRRKIIKRLIRAVDMKKNLPQTLVLDAMQLLQSASSEVWELTIKNCFRKSGISSSVPDDEDETDIDFVIDDPKVPPTEIEIEKTIEALEELSMFCEDGEILRTAVSNVNRLSQIAMMKRKKQKTIDGYFRN